MGLNKLSGTPWHIEQYTRKEGDAKRHRARCAFFDRIDSSCSQYLSKCNGASHCPYYEEKEEKSTGRTNYTSSPKEVRHKSPSRVGVGVGDRVNHISYGNGYVKELSDGRVTVMFDSGKESTFGLAFCLEKGLMRKI